MIKKPLKTKNSLTPIVTAWADFELDGPIRASVRQEKDKLTFTVENLSSLDLRDAFTKVWHPHSELASGAILEMGTIRAGEVFQEEVQIPDVARRLLRGGIASSKRLGPAMKKFLGKGWYSGGSVLAAVQFHKIAQEDLLVISDDLDLPTGQLRIRQSGGSGGHKGLANIEQRLGTQDYARLRIGIDKSQYDATDHVLGPFRRAEWPQVEAALDRAADAAECWLSEGVDVAMNRFNRKESDTESKDEE